MAIALTSDFPLLAQDNDPNRIESYQAVYAQLDALRIVRPGTPADTISRANLLKHLQQEAGKLVHAELTKTKYKALLSDADVATTLNSDPSYAPPPIHQILTGFPFAPNALTSDDVLNSK